MMGIEPVHLTKETLLIMLYGKAVESRSKDPILRDEAAEEAVRRLDRALVARLLDHLPGGQMAFDACSRLGARLLRAHPSVRVTGASLGSWGSTIPGRSRHGARGSSSSPS
ncbi:hypothetical protein [Sorangium sp. So ce1151]|uniref:hypothetical protein n=1 Tax=Sorangium sp. So ce1151 TaxID=3133332 RepID=UPI003F602F7F